MVSVSALAVLVFSLIHFTHFVISSHTALAFKFVVYMLHSDVARKRCILTFGRQSDKQEVVLGHFCVAFNVATRRLVLARLSLITWVHVLAERLCGANGASAESRVSRGLKQTFF